MKNIYSRIKIKIIGYAVFLAIISTSCSCNPEGSGNDMNVEQSYEVKVIDSCEYIYVSRRPWSSEFSLTHKGNCKNHRKENE